MTKVPYTERWTVRLVRERSEAGNISRLSSPAEVVALFNAMHGDSPVEVVVAFYLNVRHRVVGHSFISQGSVDGSIVVPADVFRPAILAVASAVIVVHNHPSGEVDFSPEDGIVARRLAEAGRILGVALLDFLAVAHDGRYSSAAEGGLL